MMPDQERWFQALDVYMMRTPVLPLEVYQDLRLEDGGARLAIFAQIDGPRSGCRGQHSAS